MPEPLDSAYCPAGTDDPILSAEKLLTKYIIEAYWCEHHHAFVIEVIRCKLPSGLLIPLSA